jgi:hypothetical protein
MVARHKRPLTTHKQTTTMPNESTDDTQTLDYWYDDERDNTPPDTYDEVFDIEIGGWED